ncbi:unnamed protein product, partial [Closterium sp. NIES-53]
MSLCKTAGRSKARRRQDTKNLLKQGNEVRSRPHSASSTNTTRHTTPSSSTSTSRINCSSSSASRAGASSSSANSSSFSSSSDTSATASSSSASSPGSFRLRRVSSSSAPNIASPGSSSTS